MGCIKDIENGLPEPNVGSPLSPTHFCEKRPGLISKKSAKYSLGSNPSQLAPPPPFKKAEHLPSRFLELDMGRTNHQIWL